MNERDVGALAWAVETEKNPTIKAITRTFLLNFTGEPSAYLYMLRRDGFRKPACRILCSVRFYYPCYYPLKVLATMDATILA